MVKLDIFEGVKEHGTYFPALREYRLVKVINRYGRGLTHMKDIATGFIVCGFTTDECKKTIVSLLGDSRSWLS